VLLKSAVRCEIIDLDEAVENGRPTSVRRRPQYRAPGSFMVANHLRIACAASE
jgi:hypothetical protein